MSQGARKLFHLLIKRLLNKSGGQALHPYFNNIFISVLFYFRGRFSVTNQRFNRTINTVKKCKYIYYLWIWREIILWSVIYGAFTYGARNKSAKKRTTEGGIGGGTKRTPISTVTIDDFCWHWLAVYLNKTLVFSN